MSRTDGAAAVGAQRLRAGDAEISYDPAVRVLTVVLGTGGATDSDELVHGLFTFYDATALGRLVRLQALLPEKIDDSSRLLLADHLGTTVATWCLRHIDEEEDASEQVRHIPPAEWRELRYIQWPALHEAARARWDLDPLPWPERSVEWRGSFAARARPAQPSADIEPESRLFTVTVPSTVATAARIGRTIDIVVTRNLVRLATTVRWKSDADALAASVLHPEPWTSQPVRFRRAGNRATAVVELAVKPDASSIAPLVVHLEAAAAPSTTVLRTFRCRVHRPGAAVRDYVGTREPVPAGTTYSRARMGKTRDRIFWQASGKPPIEVVVVREGTTLWARGFAKKSRRAQQVGVKVVLRPEAIEVLAPGGKTTVEAGTFAVAGIVNDDGRFQFKLAEVSKAPYRGELVERLELDIG